MAAPPEVIPPQPDMIGPLLADFRQYGATLVVAVLAILALWRIAVRLEKSWLDRAADAKAAGAKLEEEGAKRLEIYREVQKVADTMTAAVQGITMATEHRTEMTKNLFDAQATTAASLGRFAETLNSLARQNEEHSRDLDQLLRRSEQCKDQFNEVAHRIEDAARRVEERMTR